jgi:hypothetical protein
VRNEKPHTTKPEREFLETQRKAAMQRQILKMAMTYLGLAQFLGKLKEERWRLRSIVRIQRALMFGLNTRLSSLHNSNSRGRLHNLEL